MITERVSKGFGHVSGCSAAPVGSDADARIRRTCQPLRVRNAIASAFLLVACGASEVVPAADTRSAGGPGAPSGSAPAVGGATNSGATTPAPPPPPEATSSGQSCGALGCLLFDTPQQALARVLAEKPLMLAVGESHAPKGIEGVRSSTAHFRDELLGRVAPMASDLVLELWVVDPSCKKTAAGQKTVEKVAEKQKEVTKGQASGNQNEFVALGDKAKALGVQPHLLRPSCEEYDTLAKAKNAEEAAALMLGMLTTLTARKAQELYKRNADAGQGKMILTYGGAIHNDLAPPKERADWSFGDELQKATGGHYVALDIIVPEFIKDNDTWRELPWYGAFDRTKNPSKTTLFNPSPGSYVLIFPADSGKAGEAPPSASVSASSAQGSTAGPSAGSARP